MLKRKLYTASFISCFVFAAIVSDSRTIANEPVKARPIDHPHGHHFDSSGLCTCLPFNSPEELAHAPRIQLNKNVAGFVRKYNKENGFYIGRTRAKCDPYFAIIDSIFCLYDVPAELKYLAYIESGLKHNAISWAGAVGPWALMPVVAKDYGLKISRPHDERLEYYKSTHIAAQLLSDLYKKYHDWLLVIAAYNAGPGWIQKAMKLSGSKNFWTLQRFLPQETQKHVKKFIAVHYYFEGHGSLTTLTKAETEAHEKAVKKFLEQQEQIQLQPKDSVILAVSK